MLDLFFLAVIFLLLMVFVMVGIAFLTWAIYMGKGLA
jgi:hypothetical protein